MSELFENDEEKVVVAEDALVEVLDEIDELEEPPISDARRRLENLLDEKRLRDELDDFPDF